MPALVAIAALVGAPVAASAEVGGDHAATWVQVVAAGPSARFGGAMAYDARTRQVVLFGGLNFGGAVAMPTDTWTWSGRAWTLRAPAHNPGGHYAGASAYDAALGRVLMCGGTTTNGTLDPALWSWDGKDWTSIATPGGPSGRFAPSLAYDSATNQLVMFGGSDGVADQNDTWTWDGTTWTEQHPATSPTARYGAGMAYDARTGRVVLFGGLGAAGYDSDTWQWDGTNWSQSFPQTSPSPRQTALSYDVEARRVVLFSGVGAPADTWSWDGSNWALQATSQSPSARQGAALAYDRERGDIVLFGGFDNNGVNLSDTWLYKSRDA